MSSAAQKTFGSRDLRRQILSYGGKTCRDLTDDYKGCVPPFRYRNSQTGQVKICYKECYQNMDKWLQPMLSNLPTRYEKKVKTAAGKTQKIAGDLTYSDILYILFDAEVDSEFVHLTWSSDDPDHERNSSNTIAVPASAKDAAVIVRDLMHKIGATSLVIHLGEPLDLEGLSFPGNAIWNRFAPHIARDLDGDLHLDFSERGNDHYP